MFSWLSPAVNGISVSYEFTFGFRGWRSSLLQIQSIPVLRERTPKGGHNILTDRETWNRRERLGGYDKRCRVENGEMT